MAMLSRLRRAYGTALMPAARLLVACRVSPNAVTCVSAAGASVAALWFFPRGALLCGALTVAFFLLGDGLDGVMARLTRTSRLGAFLDSTLDRVADAAILMGLALWAADRPRWILLAALSAMAGSFLVPYVRARAEAEGWSADHGPCERTERLALVLVPAAAVGAGLPQHVLGVALVVVAVGSALTTARRAFAARRAALASAQLRQEPPRHRSAAP